MPRILDTIGQFFARHTEIAAFLKDLLFSLAVVALIAVALYLYSGGWPPVVAVNGTSMYPNMHDGDLVFVQSLARTDIKTYMASVYTNYSTYSDYGDVIVYSPYGTDKPVIHRAMYHVDQGDPMWPGGPEAPWSGYITRGDHNNGVLDQEVGICYHQPVKDAWIIGVSKFKVPYLGYIRSLLP